MLDPINAELQQVSRPANLSVGANLHSFLAMLQLLTVEVYVAKVQHYNINDNVTSP